jgi:competence protein ComEC
MPRAGWLALGAICGALLATTVSSPGVLLLATAAALLVAGVAWLSGRVAGTALGLAAALILARALAGGLAAPDEDILHGATTAGTSDHSAVVLSLGAPAGGQQRAVLRLRPPEGPEHVYAWLPRYPALIPGDEIDFRAALEPAPEGPGFGEFLTRSGIAFTARARTMQRVATGESPLAMLEQLRRAGGEALARALPEPQAGLAGAILIGLRDLVSRDVTDAFRVSGLSHVVAISGFHIALVGGVFSAALRGLGRRPRSLLVLVAIIGYAVLAGASPSVVRAALMATVVVLARESGRSGRASAALGLAAIAMLLVDPGTVRDIGFQLSLTATAGLLGWAGPIGDVLRPRLPQRLPGWLVETLAVSLAAQAATLPLVLLHFGRLSLVAPLANLLVAPIVAPVMLAAAIALGAGMLASVGLPAIALAPFSVIGSVALGTMITVAGATASLPFASVELAAPADMVSAGIAGLCLLLAARRSSRSGAASRPLSIAVPGANSSPARRQSERAPPARRLARTLLAGACALSLVLLLVTAARPDGRLHLTVLDVGQGDAILVEGPRGGRMLVDTGPDPDRLLNLLDARVPAWDRRLDMVVITHPHEDHVAGLALLLDRYRVGAVSEPGMIGLGPGDAAFRERMAQLGRGTRLLAAGDRLDLDGVRIDVHWPRRGGVPQRPADSGKAVNNVSIVLELGYGERRFLLTGDVEEEIDAQLLASGIAGNEGRAFDVLKVAHHGSGTATTDTFVERLRPRVAIVSAGWGNPYGHPSPRTVARLETAGARLFRTDLDGSVEVSTNGRDLQAMVTGGRPRPAAALPGGDPPVTAPGPGFCPIPAQAGARRPIYNRRHGRSIPFRGRADPPRARTAGLVRGSLGGSGRDRQLPRRAHVGRRQRARPAGGRGGRAAA